MRDPVTSQTVHSECPRPQPREAQSSLSLGTVNDDTGDISDEFDTTVKKNPKKTTSIKKKPKPGGTTRRTGPLDQEKRLRKHFREEMMQGRLTNRAVGFVAVSKWQDIKDKIRNMTISDAKKGSVISDRITKKQYEL